MKMDRSVFGAMATPAWRWKQRETHCDHALDSMARSLLPCGGWKRYAPLSLTSSNSNTAQYLLRIEVSSEGRLAANGP
jgi:hypothetical protein